MARVSWNPTIELGCPDDVGLDAIDTLIVPRTRDLRAQNWGKGASISWSMIGMSTPLPD